MKLFEIPVYAMSKETLAKRVEQKSLKIRSENAGRKITEEHIKQIIALETFPQSLWEYNHIIGYIVISKDRNDMALDWYAPIPGIQKYYWTSHTKYYVQNTQLNGCHFYIGNISSGEQLKEKLKALVTGYAEELKKVGYYADLEAFSNIVELLNYEKLLRG